MPTFARPRMLDRTALLSRLYEAEAAMRSRSARIGARLEIATSAMVLLQLASHADAALEDLSSLADASDVPVSTGWGWLRVWARASFEWLADLFSVRGVAAGYRCVETTARRDIELASALRAAATAAGDTRMARWCALWIEQRSGLADGLAASLDAVEPAPITGGIFVETALR
jgi:hypothetical protein